VRTLLDPDHEFRQRALRWWKTDTSSGCARCAWVGSSSV